MPNLRPLLRACVPVAASLPLLAATPSAFADGFDFTEYYQRRDPFLSTQQVSATSTVPTFSASLIRTSVISTGEPLGSGTRTITVHADPRHTDTFSEETLGDFEAGYRRFELYPKALGKIGSITLDYSLSGSPTTESGTPAGGYVTLNVGFQSATASSGFNGSNAGSVTFDIFAGNFVQIRTGANGNSFTTNTHGSASVSYRFDLFEERVHYGTQSFDLAADDPKAWYEGAAPGGRQVAVFTTNLNSGATRLAADTTWRGLISDGFRDTRIDLAGHTLRLVDNDSSVLDRSITIGEERGGNTGVIFNSGPVVADLAVFVEGRTAQQANSAGFPGSASLGIANGATLDAPRVITGIHPGTRSGLSVAGAGSRITADQITIGNAGNASSLVIAGARMETTQLLEVATGDVGATAELHVTNPGSILSTNGFAYVGGKATGILAVTDGATVDFATTKVTVGGGSVDSRSRLTITGSGTTSDGGIFAIGRGATIEVTEGATLTTAGSTGIGLYTDARALFSTGAHVTAGNLLTLDHGAEFRILSGAIVTADQVHIQIGNRLITGGAATRLTVTDDLLLNGDLALLTGSQVFANNIGIGTSGRFFADAGSVLRTNNRITVDGAIVPDPTSFIVEEPGGDDGGGGDDNAALVALSPGDSDPVPPQPADTAAAPRGSAFTIDGDVQINPTGSVELDLFGPGPDEVDHVTVLGDLTFNGTLRLTFQNGFAPLAGDRFTLLNADTLTGLDAGDVVIVGLAPGWQFTPAFDPATHAFSILSLTDGSAAPVPEPIGPIAIAMAAAPLLRRRRASSTEAS